MKTIIEETDGRNMHFSLNDSNGPTNTAGPVHRSPSVGRNGRPRRLAAPADGSLKEMGLRKKMRR